MRLCLIHPSRQLSIIGGRLLFYCTPACRVIIQLRIINKVGRSPRACRLKSTTTFSWSTPDPSPPDSGYFSGNFSEFRRNLSLIFSFSFFLIISGLLQLFNSDSSNRSLQLFIIMWLLLGMEDLPLMISWFRSN